MIGRKRELVLCIVYTVGSMCKVIYFPINTRCGWSYACGVFSVRRAAEGQRTRLKKTASDTEPMCGMGHAYGFLDRQYVESWCQSQAEREC